jgi:hypothetical protein
MKIVIFNFGDIVAPVYRLLGNIFIGTTDAIQQEPDFYEPLGDRYIQNSAADVHDQNILRAQLFGESVRRQLDQKLVTIGAVAIFLACMALLLVSGGMAAGTKKWKDERAKEAASAKMAAEVAYKAEGTVAIKKAEPGFDAEFGNTCITIFSKAWYAHTDPADDDTYKQHCMGNK